jgi:hypothetical protein
MLHISISDSPGTWYVPATCPCLEIVLLSEYGVFFSCCLDGFILFCEIRSESTLRYVGNLPCECKLSCCPVLHEDGAPSRNGESTSCHLNGFIFSCKNRLGSTLGYPRMVGNSLCDCTLSFCLALGEDCHTEREQRVAVLSSQQIRVPL